MSSELETFSEIQKIVYLIRGQRVMLDSDLARLYGVEVKRLNEQVRRNIERFPEDFCFECTIDDLHDLRSQFATTDSISYWNHKRRAKPYVFTENGVAMLSSVLHSPNAIQINISIMRVFTKLRSYLLMENVTDKRIDKLEKDTTQIFKIVFERLDDVDEKIKDLQITKPALAPARKKIGLK
jgi:hypothetical protein